MKTHHYSVKTIWSDKTGYGTKNYKSYSRNHKICIDGKKDLRLTSDPSFLGDKTLHNPEELFLASLSSCHMLWYLHLCSANEITVDAYNDEAEGVMREEKDGSGKFESVSLNPRVTIREREKRKLAEELHAEANRYCFIANSCNFKISHNAEIIIENR